MMHSLLKIDLSQINTPQVPIGNRKISGEVRLNSPKNRNSGRSQQQVLTQEASRSARGRVVPRVDKIQKVPNSARRERSAMNCSPLKITAAHKSSLILKKVDIFPAPQAPSTALLISEAIFAEASLKPAEIRADHQAPFKAAAKPLHGAEALRAQIPTNIHTEDTPRVLTATSLQHRPDSSTDTGTWGCFPQRQPLHKHSEGLPNHILLTRDRLHQTDIQTQNSPMKQESPASPSAGERRNNAAISLLDHGIEPEIISWGAFSSRSRSPKPESSATSSRTGHALFISSTPAAADVCGTKGTSLSNAGSKIEKIESGVVVGVCSIAAGSGSNFSSRSSVRVILPSAPQRGPSSPPLLSGPASSLGHISEAALASVHASAAAIHRPLLFSVKTVTPNKGRIARVIHTGANKSDGGGGISTPSTKPLKPTEFVIDTELFEQELQHDLSIHQSSLRRSPLQLRQSPPRSNDINPNRSWKGDKAESPLNGAALAVCAGSSGGSNVGAISVHELVAPSMPLTPRTPRSKQPYGGLKQHRTLLQRIGKHASGRERIPLSSPMNDSPDKHSSHHRNHRGESLFETSTPLDGSPLHRRHVSDTLNGTRTAAVLSGGLLLQPGHVDFGDLLSGSVGVSSAVTQLSFVAHLDSREKQTNTKATPLSPAAAAAIAAARTAAVEQMRLPRVLSPTTVLQKYAAHLTAAEREEIINYPSIYYLGMSRAPAVVCFDDTVYDVDSEVAPNSAEISSHDNADGTYIAGPGDQLRFRYEILQLLGRGSFGEVYRCRDHKSGVDVAVKIIKNKPAFSAQADKELDILLRLLSEENRGGAAVATAETSTRNFNLPLGSSSERRIEASQRKQHQYKRSMVQLVDSFLFRAHKCLVFPVHGRNLYEHLQDKNYVGLPMSFVRRVAVQLFQALAHLRQLGIIHCDIKPENILLRNEASAEVVLIDFGSSCLATEQTFTYIQSRFYRSPEVLLGIPYGMEIDVWSVACILPELRTANPAFGGESTADQLACITEVLQLPPVEICERSPRRERYFDSEGDLLRKISPRGQLRTPGSKSIDTLCSARRRDADFVDFLSRCLRWLPEQRLTPEEALAHPWLSQQQHHLRGREGDSQQALVEAQRRRSSAADSTMSTAESALDAQG